MTHESARLFALVALVLAGCTTSWGGEPLGGAVTGQHDGGVNTGGTGGNTGGTGGNGDGSVVNYSGEWTNAMGNLYDQAKDKGDLFLISPKPGTSRLIAGLLNQGGLWATDDAGKTWQHLGTGAGSEMINNGPTGLIYDPDHPEVFWETGSYGFAIFKTTDDGLTFKHLGDISHVDIGGVDFTDPQRQTLLVGAHERQQQVYLSRDGGSTWMDLGMKVPAALGFSNVAVVLDAQTFLLGSCPSRTDACGAFRTEDGGNTWARVSAEPVWDQPLRSSKGTFYWLLSDQGIVVSTDQGKTWTKGGAGPVPNRSGTPVELPDGRVVAFSTTRLVITSDEGKSWSEFGPPLPYRGENCGIYSVAYSAPLKTFFINHNDCSGKLLTDSLYSWEFDYSKP